MNTDVRVSTGLFHHRKLRRLARALGISQDEAAGKLVRLWCWVGAFRPSGALDEDDIVAVYGSDALRGPLIEAGFLDEDLTVHGWHERNVYASGAEERISMSRLGGLARTADAKRGEDGTFQREPRKRRFQPAGTSKLDQPVNHPAGPAEQSARLVNRLDPAGHSAPSRSSRSSRPPEGGGRAGSSAESPRGDGGPARSAGAARPPSPRSGIGGVDDEYRRRMREICDAPKPEGPALPELTPEEQAIRARVLKLARDTQPDAHENPDGPEDLP